jgi:aminomethyltransferase
MTQLQRTPLRDFQAARGARLVDFAGWEMPVQYRSILEEHRAVRRAAGLFDVSHMGEFDVRGPGAAAFLNRLVTNDVARLFPGRVLYSPMCYPDGGVVDDLLVYQRATDDFFLCVNAGNLARDLAWIRAQAAGHAVTVTDRSAETALLALQGPRAVAILQGLTATSLAEIGYYHFATGEDGFELYHAAGHAVRLAEALLAAGAPHGLELAGLGARDSLRLEAGYPLYGHELSPVISPLAAGLGWTVKLEKGCDFLGREALQAEKRAGSPRRVVYFRTGDRRILRPDSPVLNASGTAVGHVLSGTLSPILQEAIGSALVETAAATLPLAVDVRGTTVPLQLVRPPFVPLGRT